MKLRVEDALKSKWMVFVLGALGGAAIGSALLAPQPAGAVNRDMIELQQQVQQLMQGQQDLRSAVDSNSAALRTLVQQSLDSIGKLNGQMESVQKSVQEVQANTGARIDSMTQQTQGIADNMQDVQARVGKLAQQLTDLQNTLQSIDSKVSGGAPSTASGSSGGPTNYPPPSSGAPNGNPGPGAANLPPSSSSPGGAQPGSFAPVSADTLYQNALRDYTSGRYDLARQEFSDYIRNFPMNDLASNSQFYIGEIAYSQNDFRGAVTAYNVVLDDYPKSFKLGASLFKRGIAELELGEKTSGIRDLREVIRRFPGSDESRRAQAKLHEMGVTATPRATTPH
jgi:tol-pal system protein YbgF